MVLIAYFFQESIVSLQHTWRSYDNYEHGFVIVGIWLAALGMNKSRGEIAYVKPPSKVSIIFTISALAIVSFLNKVGATFEIEIVQYATTFAFAVAGALLITRPASLFKFMVLAIFLASGMPLWDFAIGILQALTIRVTESILRLMNVPVLFTGDIVDLPYGRFIIAEGCAGLKFFLCALAISTLYVFLFIDNRRRGAVFIIVACVFAVVANWFRVAGVVLIGHATAMQSDLMQNHYMYGWIVFVIFLMPTFWIGHKLQQMDVDDHSQSI